MKLPVIFQNKAVKVTGVLLLFFLLVSVLVFPVPLHPRRIIIGNIEHPGLMGELFQQWNFSHNVRSGRLTRYYYSELVSFPEGQDLRHNIGFPLNLFMYLPLVWLYDLIASYNILVMVTLTLNGFCAYLLARYLTRSFWPSLLGGILFLLSPYVLLKLEMGFLQKAILWWIPLFLLNLIRFLNSKEKKYAARAGIFWALILFTYAPYGIYALPAGLIFMGWELIKDKSQFRGIIFRGWPFAVPAVPAVVFLVFFLAPEKLPPSAGPVPFSILVAPLGSLDLFHLFRFFPYRGFIPQVESLPLGVSMVGLGLAVVAFFRRRPYSRPFLILALFFIILAIGPYLSQGGRLLSSLPFPYYFLTSYLPRGERLGFPIRALPFSSLALSILAALALSHLGRFRRRTPAFLCLGVILMAAAEKKVLLPELFPPVKSSALLSPGLEWLKNRGGVVLHLPFNGERDEQLKYHYISARTDTRMMNRFTDLHLQFPVPPLPAPPPSAMADYLSRLDKSGVDLILIHPRLIEDDSFPAAFRPVTAERPEKYTLKDVEIFRVWCGKPLYEDPDEFIAYRVPDREEIRWREFNQQSQ